MFGANAQEKETEWKFGTFIGSVWGIELLDFAQWMEEKEEEEEAEVIMRRERQKDRQRGERDTHTDSERQR